MTPEAAAAFIVANTEIARPPLVPELRLHLATEITPIWQATEVMLDEAGVAPPFWAFAWPGGQALARYLIDNPEIVAARSVLDVGSGGGLVAIAARLAGAARVVAADIDPLAAEAARVNAALNGLSIDLLIGDPIDASARFDIILIGDLCYERALADRLMAWLHGQAADGAAVLIGDPGRTYLPTTALRELACFRVPTTLELEDRVERVTRIFRLVVPSEIGEAKSSGRHS